MMSLLREIAVFLCGFFMLRLSAAQIVLPGKCPKDVKAMDNFQADRYLGKWYENQKYFFLFELGGKCITANYSLKENGTIGVTNRQVNLLSGLPSHINGEANLINPSELSKLSVRFPTLPVNIAAPYWVVDTDYDNYAVVWSCYEFGLFHTVNAWILTRERNPPQSVLDSAYSVIDKNGINRSLFIPTDQKECPDDNTNNNTTY